MSVFDFLLAPMNSLKIHFLLALFLEPLVPWGSRVSYVVEFVEVELEAFLLHEDVHEL